MKNGFVFVLMAVFLASCGFFEKKSPIETETRSPSAASGKFQPCRESRDCSGDLVCRTGWCLKPTSDQAEAWENCFQNPDCRSGDCRNGLCQPTSAVPADNGDRCLDVNSNCRSGKCLMNQCEGSGSFKAFAMARCTVGSDCISGNCRDGNCTAGSDSLSCAWVGQQAKIQTECCSQHLVNGKCRGRSVGQCGVNVNCSEYVGKVCGAPGQSAQYANECCSGKLAGSVCAQDYSASVHYCLDEKSCLSGQICHPKSKTCVDP